MQIKSNLKERLKLLGYHFSLTFYTSVIFASIILNSFKIFDPKIIFYSALTSIILLFFILYIKLKKDSKIKIFIDKIYPKIFICGIIFLFLFVVDKSYFQFIEETKIFALFIFIFTTSIPVLSKKIFFLELREQTNYKLNKKILHFVILGFIITNYLIIATQNLNTLPPQNDEFHTYSAVKYILYEGLKPHDFLYGAENYPSPDFYSRSLPYSISVASIIKFIQGTPQSIFDLRIFSILIGCISIFVFYTFYKNKIPDIVLFFSLYSFSILYIFVYHSRVARMYSLVLFLFLVLTKWFVSILNKYINAENALQQNQKNNVLIIFFKKNIIEILSFFIVIFLSLKTHFNIGFIVFPILLYTYIYSKNKYTKFICLFSLSLISIIILSAYLGFGPIHQNYFNSEYTLNWNFITHIFKNYRSQSLTLIFFLIPLLRYKKLHPNIQFSYFVFISIFSFLFIFTNGVQFHDPRYFIFLYPFYTVLVAYGLYLFIISVFPQNKYSKIVSLLFIILSICFINKIQIGTMCKKTFFIECPISDISQVLSLDRWNYQYDGVYTEIKKNLDSNTILVGRSLYNFFADKYIINKSQECKILNDYTQNRICTWDDLKKNNILFIVYPDLIYTKIEKENYDEMYNYLYKNSNKILIYKSEDSRILLYKINSI